MTFGRIDPLTIENTIDFSLVGTKNVKLDGYKYYTTSDLLTLSIDSDIYTEENAKISQIAIEFYDAAGFVGSYLIADRTVYNGNITINLMLNSKVLSPYIYEINTDENGYTTIVGKNQFEDENGDAIRRNVALLDE